jgi:hypothetical protein
MAAAPLLEFLKCRPHMPGSGSARGFYRQNRGRAFQKRNNDDAQNIEIRAFFIGKLAHIRR